MTKFQVLVGLVTARLGSADDMGWPDVTLPEVTTPNVTLPKALPTPTLPPALPLYDCYTDWETGIWKFAWDAEWKAWCCAHDKKGCPTSTTKTTTTTTDTCMKECNYADQNHTCRSRILWSSKFETAADKNPCEAARVLVVSECAFCVACSVPDSHCGAQAQTANAGNQIKFVKKFESVNHKDEIAAHVPSSLAFGGLFVGLFAFFSLVVSGVFRIRSTARSVGGVKEALVPTLDEETAEAGTPSRLVPEE